MASATPDEFFAGHSIGAEIFNRVEAALLGIDGLQVGVTKSQVAFRRKRGFAYLWLPGQYLKGPHAEVVLSIALGHEDGSPRWKEVSRASSKHWIHHLEVNDPGDIDAEVVAWLLEAAARA